MEATFPTIVDLSSRSVNIQLNQDLNVTMKKFIQLEHAKDFASKDYPGKGEEKAPSQK